MNGGLIRTDRAWGPGRTLRWQRQRVAQLRSRGVTFEEYDQEDLKAKDGVFTDEAMGKAAWFKDSGGNILSLAQLPPEMSPPS